MTRRILRRTRQATALLCAVLFVAVNSTVARTAFAGEHAGCPDPDCQECRSPASHGCCPECGQQGCQLVACRVMVPITVTETRIKNCVVKKQVEREESYTVFKRVAEPREFKKVICYLDDEVKSKVITQEQCHVVNNPVVQTYRVKVPVCEEQTEVVQREECVDGELVQVEEPCTTCVTREKEEVRTQECERPQVVFEKSTCTIDYCVKTPQTREVPCMEETAYKLVPETRTRKVTVCVPEIERRPYDVQITKMYPQTVYCCQHCAAKRHNK